MRYGAATNHAIYHRGVRVSLQQKADDLLRQSIAFGGSPAGAATDMQDFSHPAISKLFSNVVADA